MRALDQKKQVLVNKRVFHSIDYTYELESFFQRGRLLCGDFLVEDASTFIALPYPKFDNDKTGLLLGVKAKDKNFFGTLGEMNFTGYVAQNAGGITGWENRKDFIELTLSNLMINTVSMSLGLGYEHVKNSTNNGSFDYSLALGGMKLLGVRFGFSTWGHSRSPPTPPPSIRTSLASRSATDRLCRMAPHTRSIPRWSCTAGLPASTPVPS